MNATLAVTRLQFRIIGRDPWFLVIMFGMPLAIMPLMRETMGLSHQASGFTGADGAELAVPGLLVLFGFYVAGRTEFSLFREHGWKTWDRLRASPATPRQLLAGFAIPWMVIHVLFQVALLSAGALFFGLRLEGSPIALLLVVAAFSFCVISLVLMLAATFRTVNKVHGLDKLGAIVLGGIGGS